MPVGPKGEKRPAVIAEAHVKPKRCPADGWRALHHHEAGSLKMLDEPPCNDLRHDLIGVVDALAAGISQRERKRSGEVAGIGGRQLVVGHCARIADRLEHNPERIARCRCCSG